MQADHISSYSTKEEKDFIEDSANLFAILKTLQLVETAYSRGITNDDDYEKACEQLMSQKRALYQGTFRDKIGDLDAFARKWNLIAEKAIYRLKVGVPATREHSRPIQAANTGQMGLVFSLSSKLVEFRDQLDLGQTSVEDLYPSVKNLITTARAISLLHHDAPELKKMVGWEGTLCNMSAVDVLSEEQLRQLNLDSGMMYDWLQRELQNH